MLRVNYDLVCRGKISVKGKGEMLTYFLEGKAQGPNSSRSASLERRMPPLAARSSIRTKAGSISSATSLSFSTRASMGTIQTSASNSAASAPHLPSTCVPCLGEEEEEEMRTEEEEAEV